MDNFDKWSREFGKQNMYGFCNDHSGLLWLKVRAVCRGRLLPLFLSENGLTLTSKKIVDQNRELFVMLESLPDAAQRLDAFLKERTHEWYASMNVDEEKLKSDLYRIQHYAWGGDQNNSLDRHMVSRYVKVISKYDELLNRQAEIAENAWNYVQASWYNNWTSYLIEAAFKRHNRVVSAVGEIKGVDFFIDNIPLDLKVTYFPSHLMSEKLKARLGKREITWLRQKAHENGIHADRDLPEALQTYILTEKLLELGNSDIVEELREARREIVAEAQLNPVGLARWLYSNQGEMRFGAENRIFLVLIDLDDMSQSWKMKRAFSLIEPIVGKYLDTFTQTYLKKISFTFNNQSYTSLADVIFIVKQTVRN